MNNYCYVIVNDKTLDFLAESGRLPMYWSKKLAENKVAKLKGYRIEAISAKSLHRFIITQPAINEPSKQQ